MQDQSHELGLFVCSLLQTLLQQAAAPLPPPPPPPVLPPPPPSFHGVPMAHRRPLHDRTVVCRMSGCTTEIPFVPIKNSRLVNNCFRLKLCAEHLLAETVLYEGREMRFCRKCHRLEDVSEFEGARKTCMVQIGKHNQSRRDKRAQRMHSVATEDWAASGATHALTDAGTLAQTHDT